MENEVTKFPKNKCKNNNKSDLEKKSNVNDKILLILKQNWDKIELEYDSLIKKLGKFNNFLSNSEIQKEYKSLILLFNNFKSNFKNIFFNLGKNIGNINNNINENKVNDNSNKIKLSYDNINNQLDNIESTIKDINNIQTKNKSKKRKQIENLENKLHEYMDEIDKLDFNKIDKLYDNYNDNKNNIENIILQNDFIEQYNYKDFELKKENNKDNNDEEEYIDNVININTLNHDSESINYENKNKIIDDIINMKENNKDNSIKYIQLLMKKQNDDENKNNLNINSKNQ